MSRVNSYHVLKTHELFADSVHQVVHSHPRAGKLNELTNGSFVEHLCMADLQSMGEDKIQQLDSDNPPFSSAFDFTADPSTYGLPLYKLGTMGISDNIYRAKSVSVSKLVGFGGILGSAVAGKMGKPRWLLQGERFEAKASGRTLVIDYSTGRRETFELVSGDGVDMKVTGICPEMVVGCKVHFVTSAEVAGVPNFRGFYGVQDFLMNNNIRLTWAGKGYSAAAAAFEHDFGLFRPAPTVDNQPPIAPIGMAFDDAEGTKIWLSETVPYICKKKETEHLRVGYKGLENGPPATASDDDLMAIYRHGEVKKYHGNDMGHPYLRGAHMLTRKSLEEWISVHEPEFDEDL